MSTHDRRSRAACPPLRRLPSLVILGAFVALSVASNPDEDILAPVVEPDPEPSVDPGDGDAAEPDPEPTTPPEPEPQPEPEPPPEPDPSFAYWPNPASGANSDPWLAEHVAEVQTVRPRVLVLNFVNPSTPLDAEDFVKRVIDGFEEASRPQGYTDAGAAPQLLYDLARPIVDLRDGANGHPAAPADWTKINSTLFPRRDASEPGAWRFDYAELFTQAFAAHYGFEDPKRPDRFLDLCELVDAGLVHEVWVVASGDVPDVNMAEILENKQVYDEAGAAVPGLMDPCAGNGCFDADVPVCERSLRIGSLNYHRGPGCFLHSAGHGLESTSRRHVVPALSSWMNRLARFDLQSTEEVDVDTLYALSCSETAGEEGLGPLCIDYPGEDTARLYHQAETWPISAWDPICGNVHFPPNAARHYDYGSSTVVRTSCEGFGRHDGEQGADATSLVDASTWEAYEAQTPDCGGGFLTWWFQSMPAVGSGQFHDDGTAMQALWPTIFF
jgi:hypothetical protein